MRWQDSGAAARGEEAGEGDWEEDEGEDVRVKQYPVALRWRDLRAS